MDTIRLGGLELRFRQTKEGTGGALDLFEMTVRPNARMPVPHLHESWDETILGLTGVTRWTLSGRAVELGPGESLFIPRGAVHGFRNDAPEAATCLCILTPGVLGPGYFRELADLVAGGAPDPTRMGEVMRRHGLVPVPEPAA